MKPTVLFSPNTVLYLSELVQTLYVQDYFGYKEDAKRYVDDLVEEITNTIDKKVCRKAPPHFSKYGVDLLYAVFRKNKNTQWYIFFKTTSCNVYLVEYIANNHTIAQHIRSADL